MQTEQDILLLRANEEDEDENEGGVHACYDKSGVP